MEPTVPEWINSDFLKQCLTSDERYQDINIVDFISSPAAPPGSNYGSAVFRVTMNRILGGKKHKLSVVIKGPVTQGAVGEIVKEMKNSEPMFYNVFLPEAFKLVDINFAPGYFKSPIYDAIVMEDLRESGYFMVDRATPLDFAHCCLYMKAAASFHASSIALHKKDPAMVLSLCGEGLYSNHSKCRPLMENISKWSLECMANHISDKQISEVLKDSLSYIWDILVELHKPDKELSSLVQGDPWVTNMMFKYNDHGDVSDFKLLDFQNLTFGSPIHDVMYFIWLNASDDVRRRLHDIYTFYLTQLNGSLIHLGCQVIDYDLYFDTVRKFSPFALVTVANVPCISCPTPFDLNDILMTIKEGKTGTNPLEKYNTEHFCKTRLPLIVDCLVKEGIFEYLVKKVNSVKSKSS